MVSGLAGKAYHERLVKLDLESFADRREAMDMLQNLMVLYITLYPPPPIPGENDQSGLGGSTEQEKTKVKN